MSALPNILSCATCLPDQTTEVAQAANMAILFMVVMITVMLGTLVKIMFNFARRQKRSNSSPS